MYSFSHVSIPPIPIPPSPGSPTPVDVLLGKCCYYYQRHNFSHSLELASQAVAVHPRFLPPLVEKMRVQLALQDWDQAVETAQRYEYLLGYSTEVNMGVERERKTKVYVTRAEFISMWKSRDKEVECVLQVSVTGC